MKKLRTVTISGADNMTDLKDLVVITANYPFVEWGMLASVKARGVENGLPRYPNGSWAAPFMTSEWLNTSVHLCGKYMQVFAISNKDEKGEPLVTATNSVHDVYPYLLDEIGMFDRCQINIGARYQDVKIGHLISSINNSKCNEFIIQLNEHSQSLWEELSRIDLNANKKVLPFLDCSAGKGIIGTNWSMPWHSGYRGYAGGINPDNVQGIIETIEKDLDEKDTYWIDMESGVRTNDVLDLDKVKKVLEICKPFTAYA